MKRINYLVTVMIGLLFAMACNNVSYKRTKSGLTYKIISGNQKDSLIKDGQIIKFNYAIKFNDSLMDRFSSYGKLPGYYRIQPLEKPTYDFLEILKELRKGDSVVTIQLADTLMKMQSPMLPPHAKKGDRIVMTIKITDVFPTDSIAQADYAKEAEKDRPRQMKEQQEQMAKMAKEQREMQLKEELEMEKSGEAAKGIAGIEAYLKGKNIAAQKTGKGTFVLIKEQGTGPQADSGKYVTVKYTGRTLEKDSVFDSGTYPLQLGVDAVIPGWHEGLKLFRQGGKGALYIPGFRAYGNTHPKFKPFQAMIFDVEMLNVSDTMPQQPEQPMPQRRN